MSKKAKQAKLVDQLAREVENLSEAYGIGEYFCGCTWVFQGETLCVVVLYPDGDIVRLDGLPDALPGMVVREVIGRAVSPGGVSLAGDN